MGTAMTWFGSASQWLFNSTQSISSTTATGIVNTQVHGDFWSYLGSLTGAFAFTGSFVSLGLSTEKAGTAGKVALATQAMIYAGVAAVLVSMEYLVSLLNWNTGALGHASLAAQMILATLSGLFGCFGVFFGLSGASGLGELAGLSGDVGVGFGLAGVFVSFEGGVSIYSAWPSE
jgi:hypothetical protein